MKRLVFFFFILTSAVLNVGITRSDQTVPIGSISGKRVLGVAPELCAGVDAELNLKIHCARVLDHPYDFLQHFKNALDPSNLYWNLDLESIALANCDCQSECPTVGGADLNIQFPCFFYDDSRYDSPITLQNFSHPLDPQGLYWRLVLSPPRSA